MKLVILTDEQAHTLNEMLSSELELAREAAHEADISAVPGDGPNTDAEWLADLEKLAPAIDGGIIVTPAPTSLATLFASGQFVPDLDADDFTALVEIVAENATERGINLATVQGVGGRA